MSFQRVRRTKLMRQVEDKFQRPLETLVPELVNQHGLSHAADELGVSPATLGYWMLLGLSAWVLAYGMDIDISLLVATLLVIGTLTFVGLVPSLPASVGTFEFAVFYLLTTIGVGDGDALAFALVIHLILFMPPILIAVLVFATWAITGRKGTDAVSPGALTADSSPWQPPPD